MPTIIDQAALEGMTREALEARDVETLRATLAAAHPADVADVIDRLDDDDKVVVFRMLDPAQATEVLDEAGWDATRELVSRLSATEIASLLNLMPMDDAAELLSEDVPERQQALLAAMRKADAEEVRDLLAYPARSAGRLMTERFVSVDPEMTVTAVLQLLRELDTEVETFSDLFALDAQRRLIGVIAIRDVLGAQPERLLSEILRPPSVTVEPETDQEIVARLVSQYDLLTLPVVNSTGHMLGIVTVDDVIDVLVQENTEDVLRFGAVESGNVPEAYFDVPVFQAVRRRVGWLMILFLTGTMTINVLGWFEEALAQVVALSFFIPLLIGTGGNTGAQTVSTMVRGIALGEIRLRDAGKVIMRELTSGLILGLLLSIAALGMALLLGNSIQLASVVAVSIIVVCTWANTMGAIVPLVVQRFGLDPALVSAPLITTLVDATGLAIYLLIARALLGL
jgi:magnesium transporter